MQSTSQQDPPKPPTPPKYRINFGEVNSKNRKVLKILNDSCLPIKYSENFYLYIEYGKRFAKLVYYKDVPIAAISWKIDKASEHTQEKEVQRLKQVEEEKKKKEQGQGVDQQKNNDKQQQLEIKKQQDIQQSTKGKSSKSKRKQKQKAKLDEQKEEDDPNDQKMVYMMTITVLQEYRKMGFGQQILKLSEDLWRQQGYKTIILDVQISNQPAIQFYKKHGFKQIREKQFYYTDLDPPHSLFFKKDLLD